MNDYLVVKQRFMKVMKKIGAEDFWNERSNGSLSIEAHCGKTLDTFFIVVEFSKEKIIVTTTSCLAVEEKNRERVDILLKSIDEILPCGAFYVDKEDNNIAFFIKCDIDLFEELESPFQLIFFGGDLFGVYTEAILKALLGANMYYITL